MQEIAERTLTSNVRSYYLTTSQPAGVESFFAAVRETLPLDPPLTQGGYKWDALSDSLWEGLSKLPQREIIIVWVNFSSFETAAQRDAQIAVTILEEIAESLSRSDLTLGQPKRLTVLLLEQR